jgi:fatty-acyl-CoA synthase
VAYVQPQPGKPITAQELMDYMRGKIASFKIPRHIVLVEDFPMTGSGKIQKVKLRAAASDQFHGPKAQAKA